MKTFLKWFGLACLIGFALSLCTSCTRRPQPSDPETAHQHQAQHTPDVGAKPRNSTQTPEIRGNYVELPAAAPTTAVGRFLRTVNPVNRSQRRYNAREFNRAMAKTGKQKCKGCTIVYGSVDNLSQTGKKATAATGTGAAAAGAGAQQATDSATLTSAQTGNAATQQGDGNQLEQKATVEQAPDWRATLAAKLSGPLGMVLGLAGGVGILYLIYAWRRKRAAQDLIA
ncbi:hypothetical protein F0P96_10655 [Hymenobacter busanensis]|uniref:Uncharacterized protein n=1 Tax=Hymenobacter busanensis TaxID=2607656 RepID=A0A7L4ZWM2_9BACT|nr:hypothetical protein [Hymenobacter busanensis]KAA9333421.1 hypothetical protein F0P96_10655 [Hymenobacter busanensis]QHJ07899.1 hypothetical protein GUY19_11650 [Hymenobacter busanensis]